MPGTWSVYTDPTATCNVHRARGRLETYAGEEEEGCWANYVAFHVVYAGGTREKRRNFSCLHRQAEETKLKPMVQRKRERVRVCAEQRGGGEEEHLRVCAPVPRS